METITQDEALLAPVVKSLVVPLSPERAFALFTAEIQRWWPLASHSVFGDDAAACAIEGRVGGRIYESHADGRESVWGTVTAWEPPGRFACTWHPGRTPATQQELEVRFEAAEAGTLVTLTHRGWERLGAEARRVRENYETGWEIVLARLVALA
jgi:uncharacterized protein YndB with AHSA1/START domain